MGVGYWACEKHILYSPSPLTGEGRGEGEEAGNAGKARNAGNDLSSPLRLLSPLRHGNGKRGKGLNLP